MRNTLYFSVICFLLVLFVTSCTDDGSTVDNTVVYSGIDLELKQLLDDKGGIDYFVLPLSNDYSNIPQDPNNKITSEKVALGKKLFFETGLAQNPMMEEGMETYSCATCHVPGSSFQAGIRQGIGDGGIGIGIAGEARMPNANYDVSIMDIPPIRVPNNLNTAFITNAAWDGKLGATGSNIGTEDLWVDDVFLETNNLGYTGVETQAIAGLEFHRMTVDPALIMSTYYRDLFDMAFSEFPSSERYSFETAGLAIAAYERTMMTNQAPFQDWLNGNQSALTENQKLGAVLFFDKAGCVNCHTGPSLNANEFHAMGMGELLGEGVIGDFSDVAEGISKGRGGFTGNPEDDYKFKTPQLYNLRDAKFLGHGATFTSLREVIEYKNNAILQNSNVPSSQISENFQPLNLSNNEIDLLLDFMENGLYDSYMDRYVTQAVASGNCFPNNDPQSQSDMGCN